jgi:hypothetical protein
MGMIIKRKEDLPSTLGLSIGITKWNFPSSFSVFSINDSDCFHILSRGNFRMLSGAQLDCVRPEEVNIVQRCGPPVGRG